MVTNTDSKASSDLSGLDSPPSYDFATLPISSSSSTDTGTAPTASVVPKDIEHLFSGPPNAEPLLGRNASSLSQVSAIDTHKKWGKNVTFDPALENPEVLYDWIRYQTLRVPKFNVHVTGAHFEIATRDEVIQDNGVRRHRRRGQTERVIDFDFTIDLKEILDHPENIGNIHLNSVASWQPTSRGTFVPHYGAKHLPPTPSPHAHLHDYTPVETEYTATDIGARLIGKDANLYNGEANKWRFAKGLPKWIDVTKLPEFWSDRGKGKARGEIALAEEEVGNAPVVDIDQALRAWCAKYCADQGYLKSFILRKWVWGWEVGALEAAIKGAVLSTGYQSNDIKVSFDVDDFELVVRPPNLLSRIVYDTPWYLMILIWLLTPFLYIFQRAHTHGGAPYDLARASYAMKYYIPLPSTYPGETIVSAQDRLQGLYKLHPEIPKNPVLHPGPKGVYYLLGRKEGEWFREWEERIRMGVKMRYRGELMNTRVGQHDAPMLDGY